MNYDKVLSTIHRVLEENKEEKLCLFIDGQWGIGKTYTINEFEEKNKGTYDIKYISVFGKESIKDVEKGIVIQMIPLFKQGKELIEKSSAKIFGNVIKDLGQKFTGIDLDFTKHISIENIEGNSNVIICIDDLERKSKKIDLKDMLGFIERASSKFNVILIGSSINFSDTEKEDFIHFKEKVVDYEFVVDELNIKTLSEIIQKKLGNIDSGTEASIIDIFRKSRINNELPLNNLRIFKKYIDLIYRLNVEVNNILNHRKFNLDQELIDICNYTVYKHYLLDALKEKEYKYNLSYYKEELKIVIENIFRYEEYDKEILSEYFESHSQVQSDIIELRNAYRLTKAELLSTLKRIKDNIEKENLDYFIRQRYIISLYDAIKDLGAMTKFEAGLYKISEMLYVPQIDCEPDKFNFEDWNYCDYVGEKANQNITSIIKHINNYNSTTYKEYIDDQFQLGMINENIELMLATMRKISFDEANFNKVFEWAFEKLENGFKEEIFEILNRLIYSTDSEIASKYIMNKKRTESDYFKRSRLNKLYEILDEKMYYENQLKEQELFYMENEIE